jgi:hypothetical protein
VEPGIPEEAYDLECSDFDLKVSVLQEFLIMDEKFRDRLKYLEEEHACAYEITCFDFSVINVSNNMC